MKIRLNELRVIPIALAAAGSLLALKTVGLVFDGGYMLTSMRPASAQAAKPSWAQQVLSFPDHSASSSNREKPAEPPKPRIELPVPNDLTASASAAASASSTPPATMPATPAAPRTNPLAVALKIDLGQSPVSPGERAVLERLQERRQELESRARELDMREGLLKAAEKRLENRVGELKELETRLNGALQKRDEAETARFKSLVTMYENMKPKEAAKIFDRLDMKILVDVANQMNPRRMSDILALMSPEAAERLTVELANRASADKQHADLPKIEGRPASN